MVGYEMFANPQRDITAEQASQRLARLCNQTLFKKQNINKTIKNQTKWIFQQ
jgi:galactose-1-phosphate uridylyltransferase